MANTPYSQNVRLAPIASSKVRKVSETRRLEPQLKVAERPSAELRTVSGYISEIKSQKMGPRLMAKDAT